VEPAALVAVVRLDIAVLVVTVDHLVFREVVLVLAAAVVVVQ
jgi:hypothetical protein